MAAKRPDPKTGELYRHYKGDIYKVLAVAQHSESGEYFIIYRLAGAHDDVVAWARPLAMFMEYIETWSNDVKIRVARFSHLPKEAA